MPYILGDAFKVPWRIVQTRFVANEPDIGVTRHLLHALLCAARGIYRRIWCLQGFDRQHCVLKLKIIAVEIKMLLAPETPEHLHELTHSAIALLGTVEPSAITEDIKLLLVPAADDVQPEPPAAVEGEIFDELDAASSERDATRRIADDGADAVKRTEAAAAQLEKRLEEAAALSERLAAAEDANGEAPSGASAPAVETGGEAVAPAAPHADELEDLFA